MMGLLMTNTLSAAYQSPITYLAGAQIIMQQLLQTVSGQDYVNIIMFNSGGSSELSASGLVLVKGNVTSDPNDHPELDPLETALLNQNGSNQQGPSNLTAAIESAFSNFKAASPNASKVIVVLMDAWFVYSENVTLPETQLQTAGVKVLIYKLPQANDNNVYLSNSPLLGSLCRIGGTFEVIEQDLNNPLYAIKSYFFYLASTHMVALAVAGKPLWTNLYLDFDEISTYITSVTFPAFGADGQLLGVAGIDVYIDELGNLTDLVKYALPNQTNEGSTYPTIATLNQLNCSVANATSPVSAAQRCGSTALPANGGLCEQTDLTSSFESIVYSCSTCSKFQLVSTSKHHVEIVGLSIGAGVAVLFILAIVTIICCSRHNYYSSCWSPPNEDTVIPPIDSPNQNQSPPIKVPSDESVLPSSMQPFR
ncbi:hypothetical protein BDL97_01G173200 [Sphagnum fallax]|nr:hypothetical protein BDL97_01G173200 [Sphagnum fallax]